jgi:hypothetical protein
LDAAARRVLIIGTVSTSPQSIPHTEHPRAYENKKALIVKFLDPHHFVSQRWTPSVGSPSPSTTTTYVGSSVDGTPNTIGSGDTAVSVGSFGNIGSPLLPVAINGSRIKDETEFPIYEFQHEPGMLFAPSNRGLALISIPADHDKFQENVIGKKLLLNAPVESIMSRRHGERARKESETQYLRLWDGGLGQSIMFYANNDNRYVEYEGMFVRLCKCQSPDADHARQSSTSS